MYNFVFNTFLREINSIISEQRELHFDRSINKIADIFKYRKAIIKEIVNKAELMDFDVLTEEIIIYENNQFYIDITIYDKDQCVLAIEITSSRIKGAIENLNHIESLYKILITYHNDKSFCRNLLTLFDQSGDIHLIHIPNLKYLVPDKKIDSVEPEIKNINSPLETMMEKALKKEGIKHIAQYAVYNKMGTRINWNPRYIIDFAVFGERSKIAIECDGLSYHLSDYKKAYDTERDIWLIQNGFDDVIHFRGDELKTDLLNCISKIQESITSWDQFHKKKADKGLISNRVLLNNELTTNVKKVVKELLPFFRFEKRSKKETSNDRLKRIVAAIFRAGFSPNIQTFYFNFPQLSELIGKGKNQCAFVGYNIPFILFYVDSLSDCLIPAWLRKENKIIKLIVYESNLENVNIWANITSFVLINGRTGKIKATDIKEINIEEKVQKEIVEFVDINKKQEIGTVSKKTKYYVVWEGKQKGIFTSWEDCKQNVLGVPSAKYKSFSSQQEAEEAFQNGWSKNTSSPKTEDDKSQQTFDLFENTTFIEESICVDAACSGNPGDMEYKGVYTRTGKVLFHFGPTMGTNNIGEFLAIVHGLGFLKKHGKDYPIYSDSLTAIAWVRNKKANTKLPRNKETERVWQLIERAEKWLIGNKYNSKILKWETDRWGEVKADFGRK